MHIEFDFVCISETYTQALLIQGCFVLFIGMGLLEKIVLKWVILTLGLLLFLLPFVSSYFPSESNARLHPPFYHFICSSNSTVMVQKENKLIFRGIYTFFMSFDFHIEDLILYKGMLHFPICFSSHSDENEKFSIYDDYLQSISILHRIL